MLYVLLTPLGNFRRLLILLIGLLKPLISLHIKLKRALKEALSKLEKALYELHELRGTPKKVSLSSW